MGILSIYVYLAGRQWSVYRPRRSLNLSCANGQPTSFPLAPSLSIRGAGACIFLFDRFSWHDLFYGFRFSFIAFTEERSSVFGSLRFRSRRVFKWFETCLQTFSFRYRLERFGCVLLIIRRVVRCIHCIKDYL